MLLCEMKDVKKIFHMEAERVEVLKGINLVIKRGEFASLMGQSGSGKTTLMNIIGCLDTPTSGTYILDGKDVSHLTDDELSSIRNQYIGFVFQSFYLLPYATVLENILLPTLYSEKMEGSEEKMAMELLDLVGLKDKARYKPSQLSGGQQQRVAIARALINQPELILADEPTGQLDSRTSQEIMELFARMNRLGKTILVVTHDPAIAKYSQRIIRISDGLIQQ